MTLYADSSGAIVGYFDIPANVPAGNKLVRAYGAGGSYAEAQFTGRGTIVRRETQPVPQPVVPDPPPALWDVSLNPNVDPLGQTFLVPVDTMVCGIDLKFAAKGTTDCVIQLRETSAGYPTQELLAQVVVPNASISIDQDTWTRATWTPVMLRAGVHYAISASCGDAVQSLRYAELGKYDARNARWVTEQPYSVGVMVSSSDGYTWTADQTRDLTFRLLQPTFTDAAYRREITLDPVAVTSCDYFMVLGLDYCPSSDCAITYEVTVPTTPTATTYTVPSGQPVCLAQSVTGNITWKAILQGAAHVSPTLFRSLQLAVGTTKTSGSYYSRQFPIDSNGSDVVVTFVASLPSPATVAVYVQTNDDDDSPTWSSALSPTGSPKLVSQVGGNWYERKYTYENLAGIDHTRLKIVLAGTAQARPQLRELQTIAKLH